jgi:hypothetical protein
LGVTVKYFHIKQDRSIEDTPEIKNFINNIANKTEIKDKANILYVKKSTEIEYTDFMERPLLLVSDVFKNVVKLYNKGFAYKAVALTEEESEAQKLYWNIDMPETACLSPKSELNPDGTLKRIVISEKAAQGGVMLKIKNKLWSVYVIRLEMAESLLRRGLYGFSLEELLHE